MTTIVAEIDSFLKNQNTFINQLWKVNEDKLQQNHSIINCEDVVQNCNKHRLHCVLVLSPNERLNKATWIYHLFES